MPSPTSAPHSQALIAQCLRDDQVLVPRSTLEWIKAKAVKHGHAQIAFVCDKLLKGEEFSLLRDGELERKGFPND